MDANNLKNTLSRAIALHQAGRLAEAERLYRQVLEAKPAHAEANHNLGVLAMQAGKGMSVALPRFEAAWQSDPTHQQHWLSYLRALVQSGEKERSRQVFADGSSRGLKGPDPDRQFSETDEDSPANETAWFKKGQFYYEQGRLQEARSSLIRALSIRNDYLQALHALAAVNLKLYRPADAEAVCRKALVLRPESGRISLILAEALLNQKRPKEAMATLRQVLEREPSNARGYKALLSVLQNLRRREEALELARNMTRVSPGFFDAYTDLGTMLMQSGELAEAAGAFRQSLELSPDNLNTRSGFLFCLNYMPGITVRQIFEEARVYGSHATARARTYEAWKCNPAPERLRVGLVSGDLRTHPVGYFLENVLAHSDRSRIEWVAYSANTTTDALQQRLKNLVDHWTVIAGLPDERCAGQIYADGVHVLLDLSGHTRFNRLPVFAWRPAPVQASWLAYFATTGVAEMDYFIADEVSMPLEEAVFFSEKVWRLPETRLCFTPPDNAPDVGPSPALDNGHITFGSFQTASKLSDEVLATWAKILSLCPDAQLRIQSDALSDDSGRLNFMDRAKRHGIPASRLGLFKGDESRESYLRRYAAVDIVLDTFPFPGGTTTCEALWMGVPTLTLSGDRLVARQGASLLRAAGLADWISGSREKYIKLAAEKANDPAGLSELRARLREQFRASPVCDAERFALNLTDALWAMWEARNSDIAT